MAPTGGWARRGLLAALLALGTVAAACGDDDDEETGAPPTTAGAEGEADTTTSAVAEGDNAELCALAQEMADQEDFPTAEQIERYQELAPEEIRDAVEVAAPPYIEAASDPVALFNVAATDEVEVATAEINAWETEECGVDHSEDPGPGPQEPEAGAAVVDVTATEYTFQVSQPVAPGRTSLRLVNEGAEAHFLIVAKLAEGRTLQEALEFEGDAEEAGIVEPGGGESGLAAAGGDEEFVTVDLEPGTYGLVCFVPGPDGTPHAFMGMAVEMTVG